MIENSSTMIVKKMHYKTNFGDNNTYDGSAFEYFNEPMKISCYIYFPTINSPKPAVTYISAKKELQYKQDQEM